MVHVLIRDVCKQSVVANIPSSIHAQILDSCTITGYEVLPVGRHSRIQNVSYGSRIIGVTIFLSIRTRTSKFEPRRYDVEIEPISKTLCTI